MTLEQRNPQTEKTPFLGYVPLMVFALADFAPRTGMAVGNVSLMTGMAAVVVLPRTGRNPVALTTGTAVVDVALMTGMAAVVVPSRNGRNHVAPTTGMAAIAVLLKTAMTAVALAVVNTALPSTVMKEGFAAVADAATRRTAP